MKKGFIFLLFFISIVSFSQESDYVSGTILNSKNNLPLENVNIVNLNKVIGTATSKKGEFEINAQVDDTLHFSYLGFKTIKVRVTNDWNNQLDKLFADIRFVDVDGDGIINDSDF